ncbi:FecR domain-containing protein [bacterium]|nr:FecR domain-containing protein [bacterium]
MKKSLLITLLFSILLGEVCLGQDSGTRFSSISGEVNVRPDEKADEWQPADIKMVLKILYHVKTSEDSSAILSFSDLTTFILKDESEVVLTTPPEKDSKIKLVAGNVWVNAKKMFKNGTIEIEMNQSIAGIKGTNITCKSNRDGSEDRIQVLRGFAEVLIKETQEVVPLKEGEELIVKKDGKSEKLEIDVEAVKESWKDEISKMGETIELNEIPETLHNIMTAEAESFKGIQEEFKELSAAETVSEEGGKEFKAHVERFEGALMEDQIIFLTIQQKLDRATTQSQTDSAILTQIAEFQKQLSSAKSQSSSFQSEAAKMLKEDLKTSKAISSDETQETEQLAENVETVWSDAEFILREVEGNSTSLSQDWFKDAADKCNSLLEVLDRLSAQAQDILAKDSSNQYARDLLQKIGKYQTQISNLLKSLGVVTIDSNLLADMQDSESLIADSIQNLQTEVNSYHSSLSNSEAEIRLKASLSILNNFQKARRQFINSQRLYDSVIKTTSGQKYKTAEQEELTNISERINDSFQQLGITAEELQTRVTELEDQLNTYLK